MTFTDQGKRFLKADLPNGDGSVMLQEVRADDGKVR